MHNQLFLERVQPVKGIDAVADAFSATVASDIVSLRGVEKLIGIIHKGVGATGTSTITVEACDDVSASNTSAVPFKYREFITSGSDVGGTLKTATSSGFATTAGSSQLYLVEIDAEALLASGYNFARVKAVEVVDSPVLGGIILLGLNPKYLGAAAPASIIA